MSQSEIYIFPELDTVIPRLITDAHSAKLLASYQVLVDGKVFRRVVVSSLPVNLAKKLYPSITIHLNLEPHEQTGGLIIKPTKETQNE